jgi:Domain of unknown function (DUF4307)
VPTMPGRAADGPATPVEPSATPDEVVAQRLARRYGRDRSRGRKLAGFVAVLAIAGVALAWLGWAAWDRATPEVQSELIGWDVESEHEVSVTLEVDLRDGVVATCRVLARSEDHAPVGELAFTPDDGTNVVSIRTERRATAVEKAGCTTADQSWPR